MPEPKTVLVTGSSGFIAKHICRKLLKDGYRVRGSVRSLARGDEVRAAVAPHLSDDFDLDDRLTFVELDLTRDDGWSEALQGVDVLMHTASPFPMAQPEDENDLIRPAVEGTVRALRAAHAAGVKRVVLTSSMAAVMEGDLPPGKTAYDEECWSDTESGAITAYSKSKTLAEKAAWDFVANEAPEMELTVINPGMVMGPPLDEHFGTSLQLVQRIVCSKDPAVPHVGFPVVDVRDVADMHVGAIGNAETIGHRHVAAERFMWMTDMADLLAEAYPDRKVTTRRAPDWLIRVIGLFDKSVRTIIPSLGIEMKPDNGRARRVYGMRFIEARDSVRDAAEFLVRRKLV